MDVGSKRQSRGSANLSKRNKPVLEFSLVVILRSFSTLPKPVNSISAWIIFSHFCVRFETPEHPRREFSARNRSEIDKPIILACPLLTQGFRFVFYRNLRKMPSLVPDLFLVTECNLFRQSNGRNQSESPRGRTG